MYELQYVKEINDCYPLSHCNVSSARMLQAEDFTNEMSRARRERSLNDALELLSQKLDKVNESRAGAFVC